MGNKEGRDQIGGFPVLGTPLGGIIRRGTGSTYEAFRNNISAVVDPTASEDFNDDYRIGSIWINTSTNKVWQATDVTIGAAVWRRLLDSSDKGVADGVASLDGGGKIPSGQLPALAISEVFTVASQAAMLALTAQRGDFARRTDINKTFILATDDPTLVGNWLEILVEPAVLASDFDAKGDLLVGTADNTYARLPVGPDGSIVGARSSASTGLDWLYGWLRSDAAWKRWYVDLTYGNNGNVGTSPTLPFLTVQAAVNAMASSTTDVNEVLISNGNIVENVTIPAGAKNIIFRTAGTPPGYAGGEQGLFRWGTTWTSTGPTASALAIAASNHEVLIDGIALYTDDQTPGSATSLITGGVEISIPEPYLRVFKVGKAGSGAFTSDTRQGDVIDIAGMTNGTNNGQFYVIARVSADYVMAIGTGTQVLETGGGGSSVEIRTSTSLVSLSAGKLQIQDSYLFAWSANQGGDSQDSRGGDPGSGSGGSSMGLAVKVSSNAKLFLNDVAMKGGGGGKGTLIALNGSGSSLNAHKCEEAEHATLVAHVPIGGSNYQDLWLRYSRFLDLHLSNNGVYPTGGLGADLTGSSFYVVRADECIDWGGHFNVDRQDLSQLDFADDDAKTVSDRKGRVPVRGAITLPTHRNELVTKNWVDSPSITITNANHTITRTNRKISLSTGGSDRIVTFPASADIKDEIFYIKKMDSGVGKVVLTPGSGTIEGSATWDLTDQYDAAIVTSDGTNLILLGKVQNANSTAYTTGLYTCLASVAVRDIVYLSSADTVDPADADDSLKQPVVGFVRSKPTATTAIVQYEGELGGFTGLVPGATYFLSLTPGVITATAPSVPPDPTGTLLQRVGFAKSSTVFVIQIDRDFITLS